MAPPKVSLAFVAACLLAAVAPRAASAQHITIDGRFSAAHTLSGPYYDIGANLGRQVGGNLFHPEKILSLLGPHKVSVLLGRGPASLATIRIRR